ncbi:MAG: ComF family protein [Gemmatirosa sp.]|nr:ComF family protein [Gemmatirosa sp.]
MSSATLSWPAARDALLDLLLPRHCVACERPVERGSASPACGACWARLPRLRWPQCERCGHPLVVRDVPAPADPGPRRCRWCDQLPPYVRAARSVCWVPEEPAGALVHALKYEGWPAIADGMAAQMAALAWPRDVVDERSALVPVPLAGTRQRERGYNQSERLAAALAQRWDVPVWNDVLVRARVTETQTRLTPGDRLRNVAGAFGLPAAAHARLRGTHVVLVDDVVTTGATLNACAAALIAGGARIVSYVTFGRARS